MYLDDDAPIAGGRELWGFPKKRATPKIEVESDVLVGSLHYGSVLCASATMGYKHRPADHDTVLNSMKAPNFILKIIPHVDGSPRICELVRFFLEDITLKEAWSGPAALGLFQAARMSKAVFAASCARMRSSKAYGTSSLGGFARAAAKAELSALSDRALLARFVADRDQAAFAAVVARHSAMVLGVCRRALRDWRATAGRGADRR